MSKKNNLKTRARRHAHDLQLEKQAAQKKQENAAKRQDKQCEISRGIKKAKVKRRAIRLRKGKHVKGIKITDSESKKKAMEALKAEQALRQQMGKMDVDSDAEWEEATEEDIVAMVTS